MARHIEKRFNTWLGTLDIPKDVRAHFGGKRRFVKSLEVSSESDALRRVRPLVAEWRQLIAEARGTTVDPMEADLLYWRRVLANPDKFAKVYVDDDDYTSRDVLLDALQERAEEIEQDAPGAGVKFYKRATSELTGTLDHLDDWLASCGGTARGKASKRADIKRLAKEFPNTVDITKKDVRLWCDVMLQDQGLQRTTVTRLLSSCRVYWSHLRLHEIVPENSAPFDSLGLPARTTGGNNGTKRVRFTPEEVSRLHKAAQDAGYIPLVDLITLGMYTGARIGEICALRVENVDLDGKSFEIVSSKTEAGVRTVPVHPALRDTLARLVADSKDGYVLTGLSADKWGDKRGLAKRFGRLKTSLGFGRGQDFHSIRKTVITQLHHAKVDVLVIKDIVGHERKGMTEGVYYDGATLEDKRAALDKLSFPTDA
ncbi:MAG: tyrosine-type recombinase/integrase [Alphaproteobacteria bacterium]|nr:tyrosine-type recombinase/integrase [Alphaproteobacteria bacterium]